MAQPWRHLKSNILHLRQRTSRDLGPGEPVVLTQALFYPSAWGPWRVAVHPPDVVSTGRASP